VLEGNVHSRSSASTVTTAAATVLQSCSSCCVHSSQRDTCRKSDLALVATSVWLSATDVSLACERCSSGVLQCAAVLGTVLQLCCSARTHSKIASLDLGSLCGSVAVHSDTRTATTAAITALPEQSSHVHSTDNSCSSTAVSTAAV
jgi:hypothetical protein